MSPIIRTQNYAAIAQAFADYRPELLTYLTFRTGDAADAEDIVQDTFLQLLEYEQVILPTTFKRLVFRTARNVMRTAFSKDTPKDLFIRFSRL